MDRYRHILIWFGAAALVAASPDVAVASAPDEAQAMARNVASETTAPAPDAESNARRPLADSPNDGGMDAGSISPGVPVKSVATRNIRAGEILSPGDVVAEDGADYADVEYVGMQARRSIYVGGVVTEGQLQPPILVRRNAIVEMQFRRGGLVIRTEGRALDEGAVGELVRVMNLGSRQTVTAAVVAAGRVEVGG